MDRVRVGYLQSTQTLGILLQSFAELNHFALGRHVGALAQYVEVALGTLDVLLNVGCSPYELVAHAGNLETVVQGSSRQFRWFGRHLHDLKSLQQISQYLIELDNLS